MSDITMTPEEALSQLWDVKAEIAELEERKRVLSSFLAECDPDDLRFDRGDRHYRATVTRATRTNVNLMRLAAINPHLYEFVTKPALDTDKLRESMDAGMWTSVLRDECVTFTLSSPAVRFVEYGGDPA